MQFSNQPSLSAEGFLSLTSYKESYSHSTHKWSHTTIYDFALINFRMEPRQNTIKLAQSTVYKLSDVFNGRNNPFYQLIDFYIAQTFTIQDEVKALYETYFTVSLSGHDLKGKDWDFVWKVLAYLNKCGYQRVVFQLKLCRQMFIVISIICRI